MDFPLRVMTIADKPYVLDGLDRVVLKGEEDTWVRWAVKVLNQASAIGFNEVYALLREANTHSEFLDVQEQVCTKLSMIDPSLRFLSKCKACDHYSVGEEKICYLCGEVES